MNKNKSQQLLGLIEAFFMGVKIQGRYIEVFKNPSPLELASFQGNPIRFLADDIKKIVFVWDAEILHQDIATSLGYPKQDERRLVLPGSAIKTRGKYVMDNSDVYVDGPRYGIVSKRWVEDIQSKKWAWAEVYIKGITKYLKENNPL
jgi:hypothetical protein